MKKCSLFILGLIPLVGGCQKDFSDETLQNTGNKNARGVAVVEMASGQFAEVACAKKFIQTGGSTSTVQMNIEKNCTVEENPETSTSGRGFYGGKSGAASYYQNYLSYYSYAYPIYYYSYHLPSYSQNQYCGYMFGLNYCYQYFGYPSSTATTTTPSTTTTTSSSSTSTSTDCNAGCTYAWNPTRCIDRCKSRLWW